MHETNVNINHKQSPNKNFALFFPELDKEILTNPKNNNKWLELYESEKCQKPL